MTKENAVVLVDLNNHEIGAMEKQCAHEEGLLHRAVSVFIFNSKGDWLLQKRAKNKYHSPNLWSNSCCTHPFCDENNREAASRRLFQEMGLDNIPLKEILQFTYFAELDNGLKEYEYDVVFAGISDKIPQINTKEVGDYKYINSEVLNIDLQEQPETYSIWFRKIYPLLKDRFIVK